MKRLLVCLALAVAIGGAYYNALGNGFVFDDYLLVVEHAAIPQVATTPTLALSRAVLGYRPFRTLSYVLDYRLGGMQPWIFHLSNIVYHWITACLTFLVALQLIENESHSLASRTPHSVLRTLYSALRPALFTVLLWALHPVQTDAVTYISGRRDVLGGLCLFLGLWAYLRFRAAEPSGVRRYGWLLLACVVYGFGLLSKESVFVLPLLCWLYDVQQEGVGESLRRRWALYFSVLLLGAAVLWYLAGPPFWAVFRKLAWHGGSVQANFATVVRIWVRYLTVMIFPQQLIADYSYNAFPVSSAFWQPEVVTALGMLGAVAVGLWLLARWRPLCGYGALWMLFTILPVSHIIPIQEIVAEHYLYVPLFGFCLILGMVLDAACGVGVMQPTSSHQSQLELFNPDVEHQAPSPLVGEGQGEGVTGRASIVHQTWGPHLRAAAGYGIVLLLIAAAVTRIIARNHDWLNEETLWTATILAAPQCVRAHYNLAGEYKRQKRAQDATREFATTLAIVPKHVGAIVGLGELAFEVGQYGQALAYATQAQQLAPQNPSVVSPLGWVTLALKRLDEAEAYFQQAATLMPHYAGVYAGLEAVAKERGDKEAEALWANKRRTLEARTKRAG